MKANNVMYQYQEKKMGPFGWILISYLITILFILSIAMVFVPIKMMMDHINVWTILLLLLIPLGGWLGIKVFHYARGVIWHNNHLTTYTFYQDAIHVDNWKNTHDREPTNTQLELNTIEKVVVAPYITNEYTTQHRMHHIDSSYILYIIHTSEVGKELLKIPFPNNYENINIWLGYFKEQGTPVQFTTEVLYSYERDMFTDEERLEQLETNIHTSPLDYNGNWKQQQYDLYRDWNEKYPQEEYNIKNYGEETSIIKPVSRIALLSFALMGAITFGLIELSKLGWFIADNPLPLFVMIALISFLFFFLLRHYLRWYLMLVFVVTALIFGFSMIMSFEEGKSIAYQVSENAFAMTMLFPLVVWIPYFIVKAIQKRLG